MVGLKPLVSALSPRPSIRAFRRGAVGCAALLVLAASLAHGAPPRPDWLTTPEGRETARRMWERTPRAVPPAGPRAAPRAAAPKVAATSGTVVPLVLLVGFNDLAPLPASTPAALADHLFLYDGGYDDGGSYSVVDSVREYFLEVSYGALDIRGDSAGDGVVDGVKDWRTLPGNLAAYHTPAASDFPALVADAVAAHDAAGVDFSLYDGDGDGHVDALVVVHAGFGWEDSNNEADIPSHYASLPSPIPTDDGVDVSDYILVPERSVLPSIHLADIGVYCHEIGHLLGLPELYDTTFQGFGVGSFDLMGYGLWGTPPPSSNTYQNNPSAYANQPTHLSAWSKTKLGWLAPTPVWSDASGISLHRVEDYPEALRIYASSSGREYFLVEHRQSYNFDWGWPGDAQQAGLSFGQGGLVVWHVDEDVLSAAGSWPNNNPLWKGVDVECANDADGGLDELDDIIEPLTGTSFGKAAHFYFGAAVFGAAGRPPSTSNGGAATGVLVENGLAFNARSSSVNPIPVNVSAGTVVLDPLDFQAAAADGGIEASWSPSPSGDVSEYRFYADGAVEPHLVLPSTATTALLEGLDPCVSHAIRLAAADLDGNESAGVTASVEGAPSFDADDDGHTTPDSCFGTRDDCDDFDAAVHPGAPELCDGADNDCDLAVDEGLTFDADGDGYSTADSCAGTRDDCDDLDAAVHPGAPELCDGADNDCDFAVDEGACAQGGGGGGGCFLEVLSR